jgi:hypothetical protein
LFLQVIFQGLVYYCLYEFVFFLGHHHHFNSNIAFMANMSWLMLSHLTSPILDTQWRNCGGWLCILIGYLYMLMICFFPKAIMFRGAFFENIFKW